MPLPTKMLKKVDPMKTINVITILCQRTRPTQHNNNETYRSHLHPIIIKKRALLAKMADDINGGTWEPETRFNHQQVLFYVKLKLETSLVKRFRDEVPLV